jgi:manganese transport protein
MTKALVAPTSPAGGPGVFPDKVPVRTGSWFRRFLGFAGPAYLVSVGYMDPGNWATDIEGGARFGYQLLWVLLMSNLMAVLLQSLAARLGIATGHDLAQACRREYPRAPNVMLWLLAEVAITACDLAEVIGTIIALKLLFGIPALWGCLVTAFDTVLLMAVLRLGVRKMEAVIIGLVGTIGGCLLIEVFLARPEWTGLLSGLVPRISGESLLVAIGIIGATVMPHNLYLHSSLVQSRAIAQTVTAKRRAVRFNVADSVVALNAAFLVNAAILIMAAAVFHGRGIVVTEIEQAHALLEPILGTTLAPLAFGVALLAAGQSSTVTGTLAGQIVMEGFLNIRLRPWVRRLVTRSLALAPAVAAILLYGDEGTYRLLILSQVVLSLQLPFAVIPLIEFTSDRQKMGAITSPPWLKGLAWLCASVIIGLNVMLVVDVVSGWLPGQAVWVWVPTLAALAVIAGLLAYLVGGLIRRRARGWEPASGAVSQAVATRIRPLAVRHIAAALEHKEGDAEIVSAAITLAQQHKARLTLVHIVETPGALVYGRDSHSLHGAEDAAYLEALAREVEEFGVDVETLLRIGDPTEEIVKAVAEAQCDFLIMGSHGHQGVEDLIFGHTVNKVRHAVSIPVLVVRSAGLEKALHAAAR